MLMTNAERQKRYRENQKALREAKYVVDFPETITLNTEIVTPTVTVHTEDMQKCPKDVEPREWRYACERAERAKKYAKAMPEHIRPTDLKFQSPMWQWQNEVAGRMVRDLGLKP